MLPPWVNKFIKLWKAAAPTDKQALERRLFLKGFAVTAAGLVVPAAPLVSVPAPKVMKYAITMSWRVNDTDGIVRWEPEQWEQESVEGTSIITSSATWAMAI